MSHHNVIVVSGDPKAHFIEGIMNPTAGAFKPGMLAMIDPTLPLVDKRPQYKLWDGVDPADCVCIRENGLIGRTVNDAYEAGERFFGYIPVAGDEVQVMVEAGETVPALGDGMIGTAGGYVTGNAANTTTGTEFDTPSQFTVLEVLEDTTEDTRLLVRKN